MKDKISAIIVAAGKGERAGFAVNKVLYPLYGAPVLYHTLKKFQLDEIGEVIVASSKDDFEEISAISSSFNFKTVLGGKTRTDSVKRVLKYVTGDYVLIHDGARPFVSKELIKNCINTVKQFGSAVCAVNCTDTAVYANLGVICDRLDRSSLYTLQTPQAFFTDDIKTAYSLAEGKTYTDDSAVYGEYIGQVKIIDGEKSNIKLTYKEDFKDRFFAPVITDGCKVGFGVDVHAFGEGGYITLAGERINCGKKLIAHSDGDVVLHAVTDALLSACGLDDIGHFFPDTDAKFKNADSSVLLKEVVQKVYDKGYKISGISISVQAETPRLSPYIDKMKENLSAYLKTDIQNVAISAGTSEGLGFVGENLGITAYACATLK